MQEAFRQAVEKNPNSSIVQKINKDKEDQAAERIRLEEERRFAQLRKRFKGVGRMWFGTKIDKSTDWFLEHNRIRIPIKLKKELWMQDLNFLKNIRSEQRIELLRALASGMQLAEDNTDPTVDAKYRTFFRFAPLGYSGDNPLRVSFTRPSMFFMEGISDMLNHSIEQKQEFKEFMVKKSGLKGKVGLPELFPSISRWLDHSNSPSSAPNVREQHRT